MTNVLACVLPPNVIVLRIFEDLMFYRSLIEKTLTVRHSFFSASFQIADLSHLKGYG